MFTSTSIDLHVPGFEVSPCVSEKARASPPVGTVLKRRHQSQQRQLAAPLGRYLIMNIVGELRLARWLTAYRVSV